MWNHGGWSLLRPVRADQLEQTGLFFEGGGAFKMTVTKTEDSDGQ